MTVPRADGAARALPLRAAGPQPGESCLHRVPHRRLRDEQDLGHAKKSHDDRNEADAVVELGHAEGEARRAAHRIDSDQREQQPEDGHQQGSRERAAREPGHQAHAEEHETKELGRPEGKRKTRERQRDHGKREGSHDAPHERAYRRDPERRAGAALPRHLVAVEARHHRGGFTRNVDQDRGDGAAVHRAVIDRRQHDDGAGRVELEGERDQDRCARGGAQAGQHPDQCPEQAADEGEEQVRRRQRRRKAR